MRQFVLALLLIISFAGVAGAQDLVADLTTHVIGINSRFQGVSLVAFGAVEGGGDVIVAVSGPQRDVMIRRKSRVAGIWLNTEGVGFENIPAFYRIVANKPLDTLLPLAERRLNGIGSDALIFHPRQDDAVQSAQKVTRFSEALIDDLTRRGLYVQEAERPVEFLGKRLFRATLDFPANVPVGTYDVTAYLIRDRAVVASQSIPLVVSRSGFQAQLHDFAEYHGLLFGIFAVIGSVGVGWLGSRLFRSL